MSKSHLKDFSNIADDASSSSTQEEMVIEAEVVSKESVSTKDDRAMKIVKSNMYWSMGVSLLPFPLIDLVAITTLQVRSIQQLSDFYGIPFSEHRIKNIVGALVSGLGSAYLGGLLSRSFIKSLPFVGNAVSMASMPIATGAMTYAVGKVFVQHFESGGTFLNFEPKDVHHYFKQYYQEGLQEAAQPSQTA